MYEYLIAGLLKQHTHGEPLFKNVQSLPALAKYLYQVIQDLADANVHIDSVKEAIKEGFVEGAEIQKLNGVISLYDLFKQKIRELKYIPLCRCLSSGYFMRCRIQNSLKILNIYWRTGSMILHVSNRIFWRDF